MNQAPQSKIRCYGAAFDVLTSNYFTVIRISNDVIGSLCSFNV